MVCLVIEFAFAHRFSSAQFIHYVSSSSLLLFCLFTSKQALVFGTLRARSDHDLSEERVLRKRFFFDEHRDRKRAECLFLGRSRSRDDWKEIDWKKAFHYSLLIIVCRLLSLRSRNQSNGMFQTKDKARNFLYRRNIAAVAMHRRRSRWSERRQSSDQSSSRPFTSMYWICERNK